MIEKTFEYEGVTITCKRATVRSRLQTHFIYGHLGVTEDTPNFEMYTYRTFANFLTQCTVSGDLGFVIPGMGATNEDTQAALDAFLELPAEFHDLLVLNLNEVDTVLPKKTSPES